RPARAGRRGGGEAADRAQGRGRGGRARGPGDLGALPPLAGPPRPPGDVWRHHRRRRRHRAALPLREAALAAGLLHGQQGRAAGGGACLLRAQAQAGRAHRTAAGGGAPRARDDGALRALREDRAPGGMSFAPFAPGAWTAGGHRQTLLGYWWRRRLRWDARAEDLVVEAGEDIRLLARVTWQEGPRERAPALVLVHGLGGCDAAGYAVPTAQLP